MTLITVRGAPLFSRPELQLHFTNEIAAFESRDDFFQNRACKLHIAVVTAGSTALFTYWGGGQPFFCFILFFFV